VLLFLLIIDLPDVISGSQYSLYPTMVPTAEQISDYFHSAEAYVVAVVSQSAPEVPNLREAVNRLWDDLARFGPPALAEMKNKIPVLGDFELPPPPPPPPPPPAHVWTRPLGWMKAHKLAVVGVGAIGTSLMVGYLSANIKKRPAGRLRAAHSGERRRVVGT
jgi:hypothetical protein